MQLYMEKTDLQARFSGINGHIAVVLVDRQKGSVIFTSKSMYNCNCMYYSCNLFIDHSVPLLTFRFCYGVFLVNN
jgi:hypothetical protein